jgi:hypothetical protein
VQRIITSSIVLVSLLLLGAVAPNSKAKKGEEAQTPIWRVPMEATGPELSFPMVHRIGPWFDPCMTGKEMGQTISP